MIHMRCIRSLFHKILPHPHLVGKDAKDFGQLLLVVMIAGLLVFLGGQQVFAAAGDDPTHPLFPTDSWVRLESGTKQWYAFRDEGDDTAITVRMTVLPVHGATFTVLTAEAVARWARGEGLSAVGAGSEIKLFPNDLYWTGSFVQSGTYYVLVQSSGQGASNYHLTISGSGVSFPLLSFTQPPSPMMNQPTLYPSGSRLPTPTPVATQANAPPQALSSPENPLPPIGKTLAVGVGELHWYAFRDEGDESSIQVNADATPDTCLTFQVWTPEQLRLWQLGEEFRPVGQGTANPILKADLFWTGSFVKSGIYYVVVKRDPIVQGPCAYQLTVLGDGVSLVLPPGNSE